MKTREQHTSEILEFEEWHVAAPPRRLR